MAVDIGEISTGRLVLLAHGDRHASGPSRQFEQAGDLGAVQSKTEDHALPSSHIMPQDVTQISESSPGSGS